MSQLRSHEARPVGQEGSWALGAGPQPVWEDSQGGDAAPG